MIAVMRQMLIGITAAAMFSVVMLTLVKKSALHEIVRLATGMLMILALLRPLSALHMPSFTGWVTDNPGQDTAQQTNEALSWDTFGAAIAQTIEQQAATQGISCAATVTMKQTGGSLAAGRVDVRTGTLAAAERKSLQEIVTRCCGSDVQQRYTEEAGWKKTN